jgi:hypothetical protein
MSAYDKLKELCGVRSLLEEEKDTFELNEVEPSAIIHTGFDLRQLSSHHWAYGYNLLTSNDNLQHICVGRYYSNDKVQCEWYLYKHNGAIWYRNKVNGSIASQNVYVE